MPSGTREYGQTVPMRSLRTCLGWPIAAALVLGACGGGAGDDVGRAGAIGNGTAFRGTVAGVERSVDTTLEIRSASGERMEARIGADGRFEVDELLGSGPYLLRVGSGTEGEPEWCSEPATGYWGGLVFNSSNVAANRLENVVIEYGGAHTAPRSRCG